MQAYANYHHCSLYRSWVDANVDGLMDEQMENWFLISRHAKSKHDKNHIRFNQFGCGLTTGKTLWPS